MTKAKGTYTKRGTPAHLRFEGEIVRAIYEPKIRDLVRTYPDASVPTIAKAFSESFQCAVSPSTMRRWLEAIGLKAVTQWVEQT